MDKQSHFTTDHDTIMDWVEARGGFPAVIDIEGVRTLRIGFEGEENSLEHITWDQFFEEFENSSLAFLYQLDTEDGEESHFNAFVDRKSHEEEIAEDALADDSSYDDGEYADLDDSDDALTGPTDDAEEEDTF